MPAKRKAVRPADSQPHKLASSISRSNAVELPLDCWTEIFSRLRVPSFRSLRQVCKLSYEASRCTKPRSTLYVVFCEPGVVCAFERNTWTTLSIPKHIIPCVADASGVIYCSGPAGTVYTWDPDQPSTMQFRMVIEQGPDVIVPLGTWRKSLVYYVRRKLVVDDLHGGTRYLRVNTDDMVLVDDFVLSAFRNRWHVLDLATMKWKVASDEVPAIFHTDRLFRTYVT
eukprot:TRINITY_DN9226_c0_g1_i1.p1 TRINITY_DN9226_c0_g1~~TRINITY_DN9226_c0_g1_i1.p1  ORF type:complete len:226 (-),score=22.17 TRINITY_DN9226_c0_g1_i1:311-988(-)